MSQPTPLQRALPNQLTMLRLVLTVGLLVLLSLYSYPDTHPWALPVATAIFIVAALTDALDGYLARRWQVISVFGRIMDPLADKVLVLGTFVMLASASFVSSDGAIVSGVHAWMVVVILSRELLITTMRGVLEGRGVDFSASLTGKLKMIAQSVGAPIIMLLVWWQAEADDTPAWLAHAPVTIASIITLITALSAYPYVVRTITALRA
ncbi:MAG: CDP-diacylglycerol--glycerol-3-phosphate 3-phosphatidyltransferase [Planctomycetota bacterium]